MTYKHYVNERRNSNVYTKSTPPFQTGTESLQKLSREFSRRYQEVGKNPTRPVQEFVTLAATISEQISILKKMSLLNPSWSGAPMLQTGQVFPDGIVNIQWIEDDPWLWQQTELEQLALHK